MTAEGVDLLAIDRGSIVAPAGCGKTELIVSALQRYDEPKPFLVLTHTNAGVAALRYRLDGRGVDRRKYRLATIDGWVLRLLSTFPGRSGISPPVLGVRSGADYPIIRNAACALLAAGHLSEVIRASYGRMAVDEYQDCDPVQHAIASSLAGSLPAVVLGDPMQEIFNWTGVHPNWESDVCRVFPKVAELRTPWRWINAGTVGFGEWLLDARKSLMGSGSVDLGVAPAEVTWINLDGTQDDARKRTACMTRPAGGGSVLIMAGGRQRDVQRRMAKLTPGAVTIEAVDLADLTDFASRLVIGRAGSAGQALDFAFSVMNGIDRSEILDRINLIAAGRNKTKATAWEQAGLEYNTTGSARDLTAFLKALEFVPGGRTFRPDILRSCLRALDMTGTEMGFREATVFVREQQRALGRKLPARSVGSPLLLKGLEGDVAVILDASDFDPDPQKNRKNLYVAMTRGSRQLVVCSSSRVVG